MAGENENFQTMRQYAPFPHALKEIVDGIQYRPGWTFTLEDRERDPADTHGGAAGGLTLVGLTGGYEFNGESNDYIGAMDAYHPMRPRPVYFYFPVPAATFDEQAWRRWVFDRIMEVELHEAMEHFVVDGQRPFSPTHGPGQNPYVVTEYRDDIDRRTSFRGVVTDGV
jgi:hypothetical protein